MPKANKNTKMQKSYSNKDGTSAGIGEVENDLKGEMTALG